MLLPLQKPPRAGQRHAPARHCSADLSRPGRNPRDCPERDGRRYLYSPVLKRADWVAEQSSSLVDRLFGGRIAPLVAQFSSERKLTPADLAALKQLIREYEND